MAPSVSHVGRALAAGRLAGRGRFGAEAEAESGMRRISSRLPMSDPEALDGFTDEIGGVPKPLTLFGGQFPFQDLAGAPGSK
jgi:hypothetical protein